MNVRESARRAVADTLSLAKRLAAILVFVLAITVLCYVFVYPLWYFSSFHRQGYTYLVLIVLLIILVLLVIRAILRSKKDNGFAAVLPGLLGVLRVVGSLTALYGIILLYSRGLIAAAVPLSILFLALLGYQKYGR